MSDNNTDTDKDVNSAQENGAATGQDPAAEAPADAIEGVVDAAVDDPGDSELDTANDAAVKDSGLVVVGIGASAGGLEALQNLVETIPQEIDVAFVVAQHLSPVYQSKFVEILSKNATIPILKAEDGAQLRAGEMVICPPGFNIELGEGDKVVLSKKIDSRISPIPSVDLLFESIALLKGERSIGVVLSGTGSDGTAGLRAIKAENGFGIAQDPNTASYDGMPNSAINAANIDLVMDVTEIGNQIVELLKPHDGVVGDPEEMIPTEAYVEIIKELKASTGVDFSLYKERTLVRRIVRRMTSLRLRSVAEYCDYLRRNSKENSLMISDMLIGVTSFFRDQEAFHDIGEQLRKYIRDCSNRLLRIWVPGCSTGEEAYSLAMIVDDILADHREDWSIQVFATDIDPKAISFAREGVYSAAMVKHVPDEYRNRYFVSKGGEFEVVRQIKSLVLFANHDLNRDPPFIRTDLISCRNLMIYFKRELQERAFQMFHYSLNYNGLLFLGRSESIQPNMNTFVSVSKRHKIFRSLYTEKRLPMDAIYHTLSENRQSNRQHTMIDEDQRQGTLRVGARLTVVDVFQRVIMDGLKESPHLYPLIVNENHDIVYVQGHNPLLTRPVGVPTNNLLKSVEAELSMNLRDVLHRLSTTDSWVTSSYVSVQLDDKRAFVRVIAKNTFCNKPIGKVSVMYFQVEDEDSLPVKIVGGVDGTNEALDEQKKLLAQTEYQMQTLIEELETSNEEMQAMNEELQSSNEELQSSNEELETTNEELQATNEELQTAYGEIRVAYQQKLENESCLDRLKSELEEASSLLEESSKVAKTGCWNWKLETRQFSWSAGFCRVVGLNDSAKEPNYDAFVNLFEAEDQEKIESFLSDTVLGRTRKPVVLKLKGRRNNTCISVAAFSYKNDLGQVDRVVGIVTDVTATVSMREENSRLNELLDIHMNSSLCPTYLLDVVKMKITAGNAAFAGMLGINKPDITSYSDLKLFELFSADAKDIFMEMIVTQMNSSLGHSIKSSYQMRNARGESVPVQAQHVVYSHAPNGKTKTIMVYVLPHRGGDS